MPNLKKVSIEQKRLKNNSIAKKFSFLKSDFFSNITLLKLGSPSSELHNYYVECLRQFLKLGLNNLCNVIVILGKYQRVGNYFHIIFKMTSYLNFNIATFFHLLNVKY